MLSLIDLKKKYINILIYLILLFILLHLRLYSQGWSVPQSIVIESVGGAHNGGIAVDLNDEWHVVYDQIIYDSNTQTYTTFIKYINSRSETAVIAQAIYYLNPPRQGEVVNTPRIAVDPSGNLYITYNYYNESSPNEHHIKYTTLEPEYKLRRRFQNGSFEDFDVLTHAWSFGNTPGNMWPESWWIQFDYRGIDPYTQTNYQPYFVSRYFAKRSDFPDWPIFVDAFGINQCYFGQIPNDLLYRTNALKDWMLIKGNWGGSCYGFAASCLLSFQYESEFISKFPGINWINNLHDLSVTPERARIINHLWIYQFGYLQFDNKRNSWSKTPIETLYEIKQMLFSNTKDDDSFLLFADESKSVGHAVNPYRVEKDQSNSDIEWIYIYDNNAPDEYPSGEVHLS